MEKEAGIKGLLAEEHLPNFENEEDGTVMQVYTILDGANMPLSVEQLSDETGLSEKVVKHAILNLMGDSRIYEPKKGYYKVI